MRLFRSRHSAPRRRPRALLIQEIGTGFTHARNASGIVAHLAANGVDCTFATADPRFDGWFRPSGARVLQGWLWPVARVGTSGAGWRNAVTYTDLLTNHGALDVHEIAGGLTHTLTLLDLVAPDIVLCENAPVAQLACRGRVPVITYGSTLAFMPPVVDGIVAQLSDGAPAFPADAVLDALNETLALSALPAITGAADLVESEETHCFGPAAFDPYAHARQEAVLPPFCPDLPDDLASGNDVVIYLHERMQHDPRLADWLRALPGRKYVYIPALSGDAAARLAAIDGVDLAPRMLPLAEIGARGCCLVHHGGVTLTAAAAAIGLPQVILARFADNAAAGRYLAARGNGTWQWVDRVETPWLADAVLHARSLSGAARADARHFRSWFGADPTWRVAQGAVAHLGITDPKPGQHIDHAAHAPL